MSGSRANSRGPAPRRRLPPLLRSAWYGLNQAFRRRLAPLGMTPDQFTVLRWLAEAPRAGCTQRGLTDLMSSDANTIAALLRRMETLGLVTRSVHHADARAKTVRLTETGRRLFRRASPHALDLQATVLAQLPARRRQPFLREMAVIADACRREARR